MAIIKKSANNKCWRGQREKGTLLHHWGECKFVEPLWRTLQRFLKPPQTELPYDPASPLLGTRLQITILGKPTLAHSLTTARPTTLKVRKQPQSASTGGWRENTWYIYTIEWTLRHKKEK